MTFLIKKLENFKILLHFLLNEGYQNGFLVILINNSFLKT